MINDFDIRIHVKDMMGGYEARAYLGSFEYSAKAETLEDAIVLSVHTLLSWMLESLIRQGSISVTVPSKAPDGD